MRYVEAVVRAVIDARAHKATKFVSPKHVVRATQRCYRGRVFGRRDKAEITLTIGRPNYEERKLVKKAIAAGEPFPVRKIHLRFPPKPKVKAKRRARR